MIKKAISLITMFAMVLSFVSTLNAQEDKSYKMWEDIMLTPDNTKLKVLSENMRKHNATYHKDGAYEATVYNITTGPNAGNIIWEMGPMMYKHNDTRPSEGGHDADWRDNVMPYIKKMHTIEYWKKDDKLSNTSMLEGDDNKHPILFCRYGEIADGQASSVVPFYTMVSETIKAMEGENPWGIYWNEFRQGDLGRHVVTIGFYKNWTEFDEEDNKFKETFEKVHGKENWQMFLDMGERTFSNSWDEIWEYNKFMSGK
ncbi:hypothetical protein [uncultured Algibacter sp.]|uniref:hypothetical protein n=1 Tax=uncultured Algibacter sp. TaxID=298659 RepID=UPI002632ACCF|nr:hypothetical protein [uncultured Algibacter sp.]